MLKDFILKAENLYKDFKEIGSYCFNTDSTNTITFSAILDSFKTLKDLQQNVKWLYDHEEILKAYFGLQYKGSSTDWVKIQSDIDYFEDILLCCEKKGLPGGLQKVLLSQIGESAFNGLVELQDNRSIDELFKETSSFIELNNLSQIEIHVIVKRIKEVIDCCKELSGNYGFIVNSLKGKRDTHKILCDIDSLIFIQELKLDYKKRNIEFTNLYQGWYEGLQTDWIRIKDQIIQAQKFKAIIEKYSLGSKFVVSSCTHDSANNDFSNYLIGLKNNFVIDDVVCWMQSLFYQEVCIEDMALRKLKDRAKNCAEDLSALGRWLDYRDSRTVCEKVGLASFVKSIENQSIIILDINQAFCKEFYRKWLDKVSLNLNSVSQFRGRIQNKRVRNFCILDSQQLLISQMRICEKLISTLPNTNRLLRATDEMSVLQNELSKRSRHMPIRKLFKSIPNLLMKLKPCLMMSPLSVSYFLEAETYQFDMIIFDEASQIFPQDAIGAILRGNQVVIAGDSKQLSPTNFFSASTSNSDDSYDTDSEEEEGDDILYSSILEEAANSLPSQSLKWHYRSRYESLIAFSNQEIYNNTLITFPSSIEKAEDTGVEYVYVKNGVYESRCNIQEARKCVALVIEHINRHPERSLGIIAFSEKQQSTIEDAIQKFREQFPQYEYYFDENKEEPFFVKNLENVQGDERDTIIFSICYAKDNNGKMYMRFGPLGHPGGERRLNVAITRAKCNVKLVGSLLPSDIDLNRTNSDGVKMLRSYIEFAKNGRVVLNKKKKDDSLSDSEDRFCSTISEFLKQNGYKVYESVGCSDYTINIAVEHPEKEGCFVAGIECDGNSYHMARTARDRDHLRNSILKNMGWNLYRVWSTDWIRDPKAAQTQLLDFINGVTHHNKENNNSISKPEPVPEVIFNTIISEQVQENSPKNKVNSNLYGFKCYKEAYCYEVQHSTGADNETRVAEKVMHVLKIEQPIHMESLYRRLASSFGNEKVTASVRNTIDSAIKHKLKKKVNIQDNFISMKNISEIEVRIPKDGEGGRPIEYISISEIAVAMKIIASNAFGISEKELSGETARVFGFQRRGPKIAKAMHQAIDHLKKNGEIKIVESKVQVLEAQ
jgi:hypothetical protein